MSGLALQRLKNLNYPEANRLTRDTLFAPGAVRYEVLKWLIVTTFVKKDENSVSVAAGDDNMVYFSRKNLFDVNNSMDDLERGMGYFEKCALLLTQ